MANVTVTLTGDGSKLAEQLNKLVQLEKAFGNEADNTGKKSRRGADSATAGFDKLYGSVRRIAMGVAGGLGLTNAFQQGIDMLKTYDERLGQVAIKQAEIAKEMISLQTLQEDYAGDQSLSAARVGALYGVRPAQAIKATQEMQSKSGGSFEQGLEMAREVFKLQELQIPNESAREIIRFGTAVGMTPKEASSLIYGGAKESAFGPAEFSKGMPAMTEWAESPEAGVAAMVALSSLKQPEKLETFLRQSAVALTTENDFTKKFKMEKYVNEAVSQGYDPWMTRLSYARENIAPNQNTGMYDLASMEKAGFTNLKEMQGLVVLLNRFDEIVTVYDKMKQRDVDLVDKDLTKLDEEPRISGMRKHERAAAFREIEQTWGGSGDKARERQERLDTIAQEMQFNPLYVDPTTGQPGYLGRIVHAGSQPVKSIPTVSPEERENIKLDSFGAGYGAGIYMPHIQKSQEKTDRLIQALEENTRATAENTSKQNTIEKRSVPRPQPNSGVE
jgi:hypothetical protein